jgi:hypothetical protein
MGPQIPGSELDPPRVTCFDQSMSMSIDDVLLLCLSVHLLWMHSLISPLIDFRSFSNSRRNVVRVMCESSCQCHVAYLFKAVNTSHCGTRNQSDLLITYSACFTFRHHPPFKYLPSRLSMRGKPWSLNNSSRYSHIFGAAIALFRRESQFHSMSIGNICFMYPCKYMSCTTRNTIVNEQHVMWHWAEVLFRW